MNLLLDTHVIVWSFLSPEKLSSTANDALISNDNSVFVSVLAAWEVAIKRATGKLDLGFGFDEGLSKLGYTPINLRYATHVRYSELPLLHRDPFDRMLVAQALDEGLTLVTNDRNIRRYDVPILW